MKITYLRGFVGFETQLFCFCIKNNKRIKKIKAQKNKRVEKQVAEGKIETRVERKIWTAVRERVVVRNKKQQ